MRSLPRLSLDGAVAGAIALTVVAFAAGSSSIDWVYTHGQRYRWLALVALLAVAAVVVVRGRPGDTPRAYLALAALAATGLLSAAWSVDGSLSAGRAAALSMLFAAAGALGIAVVARDRLAHVVLAGIVLGALAVLVASLLVLVFDYDNAIQPATESARARFQGFTANPNTIALLAAVSVPVAAIVAARDDASRAVRLVAGATALGLVAAIAGADSRGALVAGIAGVLVAAAAVPAPVRRRLLAGVAAVAVFAAAFLLGRIPDPGARFSGIGVRTGPPIELVRAYPPLGCIELPYEDIGQPPCGETFGVAPDRAASGRLEAWEFAVRQALKRPVAGFGFGTEGLAFIDRYSGFEGFLPENSYLGMLLQLGIVGAALLAGVVALLVVGVARVRRLPDAARWTAAACLGGATAGFVLGLYQSWLYAAGSIGAAVFWICVFTFLALAFARAR